MEHIAETKQVLLRNIWPVLVILGVAFSVVVVFYGMDSVVAKVHDTFHDFRHIIGMPCH